jgi:hypothetical protein
VVEKPGQLTPSWPMGLGSGSKRVLQVLGSNLTVKGERVNPTSIRVYRVMGREEAHVLL